MDTDWCCFRRCRRALSHGSVQLNMIMFGLLLDFTELILFGMTLELFCGLDVVGLLWTVVLLA